VPEQFLPGSLVVVPTPIGNLQDITERARSALIAATTIAAEDTRRCRKLLQLLDIAPVRLVPLHDHNEAEAAAGLIARLEAGEVIALVSDAGTPLISDPGHLLLRAVWAAQASGADVRVLPLPGASAMLTALSACPLPLHMFSFGGFLPARAQSRQARLRELLVLPGAFVVFEAPHRMAAALTDLAALAPARRVFVARELTKMHESLLLGTADEVLAELRDSDALRGEFVLVIEGPPESGGALAQATSALGIDDRTLLFALAEELPPAKAARVAARLTGRKRSELYALLQDREGS